jgi:hypothetical protein
VKLAFVSNYFNHHQRALSDALCALCGGAYTFVATGRMRQERRALGYGEDAVPPYVQEALDGMAQREAVTRLREADCVIFGGAPEDMLTGFLDTGKPVFRYSERLLKGNGGWVNRAKYPVRWAELHRRNPNRANMYLLCAGAYTAADYDHFGLFHGRALRWGYFPALRGWGNTEALLDRKHPTELLWCGRMIGWKHPEEALTVADRLHRLGYAFRLTMVGTGEMERALRDRTEHLGLSQIVTFTGPMRPEQVRDRMEQAGIFLLTSDSREGWGAVLNEAMNAGCAVVASHAAGSVPYLIRDGENGLIYQSGHTQALFQRVQWLLEDPGRQKTLGRAAYRTLSEAWNPDTAARRWVTVAELAMSLPQREACQAIHGLYREGPCSPAPFLKENWYVEKERPATSHGAGIDA